MPDSLPEYAGDGEGADAGLTDAQLRAEPVDVTVTNPSGGGGLTDAQLRASPVPVSGTVAVSNPTAQGLTDTQLRASPVPVSGTFYPATQPVSGTFWQTTQPVSGTVAISNPGLTDTQLRASPVPVSGTFYQATQPVSGTVAVSSLPLPTGAASDTVLTGGTQISRLTDGTTGPVAVKSASTAPSAVDKALVVSISPNCTLNIAPQVAASQQPIGSVSLGNYTGKALRMRTGTLVTTTTTADQVIVTYTIPDNALYLSYLTLSVRTTAFLSTATTFGTVSLETPSGTKMMTFDAVGPGFWTMNLTLAGEPLPVTFNQVIRVVCTPSSTASCTWNANFGGYGK